MNISHQRKNNFFFLFKQRAAIVLSLCEKCSQYDIFSQQLMVKERVYIFQVYIFKLQHFPKREYKYAFISIFPSFSLSLS